MWGIKRLPACRFPFGRFSEARIQPLWQESSQYAIDSAHSAPTEGERSTNVSNAKRIWHLANMLNRKTDCSQIIALALKREIHRTFHKAIEERNRKSDVSM